MRPSLDEYFTYMAALVSTRSTCPRRSVGCVLVDHRGRVLSTGYNGSPSGWAHCINNPCPGADAESGEGLDLCEAIHAEVNAISYCADIEKVFTCYTSTSPCLSCIKLLTNTGCRRVVFKELYPHPLAAERWVKGGREWIHYGKH